MKKYFAAGLTVFILALVIYLPASFAAKLLPAHINAEQYQGTLWKGSANSVRIDQDNFGRVDWHIMPTCLFKIRLCIQVEQRHHELESNFVAHIGEIIEISDLTANGSMSVFHEVFRQYGITPTGMFDADIVRAIVVDNAIQSLEGNVQLSSFILNGVIRISMGDVEAVFTPQAESTQAFVTNQGGHLDLSGIVELYTDTRYLIDLKLRENQRTNQTILNGLKYLSKPQGNGLYSIYHRGQWSI